MKFHNVVQNSDEWFALRLGKITGSQVSCLFVDGGNPWGTGAITYAYEKAAEIITGKRREAWSNRATDWGHEHEPMARILYEQETGNIIDKVGFIEVDEQTGVSPDGLVDKDGYVEIKCPEKPTNFIEIVLEEKIPNDYYRQCQFGMWATKRKWCDLVYYHPYFPEGKKLKIMRIESDPQTQADIMVLVPKFKDFVNQIVASL